jgi:ribosomal protein L37E
LIVADRTKLMGLLKTYVATGLFYLERHAPDFDAWNHSMVREFGHDVKDHLHDVRQWSLLISYLMKGPRPGKKNCWEFMACGKEIHGRLAGQEDICRAALESRLDGMHGGRSAGRACWVVGGTRCDGQGQHDYELKRKTCASCAFYQAVKAEEGDFFLLPDEILFTLIR